MAKISRRLPLSTNSNFSFGIYSTCCALFVCFFLQKLKSTGSTVTSLFVTVCVYSVQFIHLGSTSSGQNETINLRSATFWKCCQTFLGGTGGPNGGLKEVMAFLPMRLSFRDFHRQTKWFEPLPGRFLSNQCDFLRTFKCQLLPCGQ